jgi:hypothetical protein
MLIYCHSILSFIRGASGKYGAVSTLFQSRKFNLTPLPARRRMSDPPAICTSFRELATAPQRRCHRRGRAPVFKGPAGGARKALIYQ